jgi:transmembrane E3 ubiquitin-protein ligase
MFEESLTFWILESFCLLALQINYSYSMGGRGGLSVVLVATLVFMRFPHFYYLFSCPQITREPIDIKALGIFMIVNAALLTFIIMQRYFGSRFIIPKELIPDYFNYFKKIAVGDSVLD